MTDAIRSPGGVSSLSVTLCDSITSPSMDSYKIDGESLLSNIEFSEEGIHVWRAYGVGTGKLISQIPEAPSVIKQATVLGSTPGAPKVILIGYEKTSTWRASEWYPQR